jgi:hypothetical protein
MPEFSSTDWITALGLVVLVVTLGSPSVFKDLTDSSPETLPGPPCDDAAPGQAAAADPGAAQR